MIRKLIKEFRKAMAVRDFVTARRVANRLLSYGVSPADYNLFN